MTARNYQQKLDLSRFGGGADSDEDDAPTPKIVLAAEKQNTFAYGIQRKSKKDREREEEKRKKEEEERDAARVFAEFTAEFEGEGSAGSSRKSRGGFVREGGSGGPAYEPPRAPAAYGRAPGAFGRAPAKPRSPSPPPASKPKGKRVINSFLEDLKRDQAAREDRFKRSGRAGGSVSAHAAWENPKDRGSHDLGDANTTNLFVGNLPQAVTDQSLGLLFAKLGPIGSVKVMYPRFEESSVDPMSRRVGARAGLSGFVAYMKRSDAERAVHDMDGLDWGGNILKVGWSKSVPIPARPIYDITSSSSRARSRSRSPLRHAKRQRSVSPLKREKNYSGRGSSYDQRPRSHSRSRSRSRSPSHSRNPPNLKPETEKLLKTVAAKVRDLGKPFEDMLREKERDNEKFNFLRDSTLPEYHFFRSLLNPRHRMPTPPPPPPPDFVDEGYNSIYSTDSEEDSERERTRKGKLGKLARRRFVSCLRGLKGERGDIARCMAFALDHADSADEISDLIIQSLSIFETPVPLKVARLHLISDILSNSASPVPNAWKYRGAFEARLPAVFDHFGVLYSSFKAQMGRLSAEQFKSQITNVLDVLEIWIVFNPAYTDDLRVRLSGAQVTSTSGTSGDGTPPSTKASSDPSAAGPAPSKFKKGGFSSSFVSDAAEQKEEEDLDGAPMGEDLDGAPLDDSLDGEPMGAEEEDLDGEAMEDVDGEPM